MAADNTPKGNQDASQGTADRGNADRDERARRSGQHDERSRSPKDAPSDRTVLEQTYADYVQNYDEDAALNGEIPDVLIDAPVVSLKGLDFELDDLRARVSLFAKVLELVELSVGIDAHLGKVKLTIESIDVQALVKARLDNVTAILDRVLTTVDRNPRIVQELASGPGSAAGDVGEGAGSAAEDAGSGAGQAVGGVGQGAGQATQAAGEGAGQATQEAGDSAGRAVQDVSGTAGQAGDSAEQANGGAQKDGGRSGEGDTAPGFRLLSETTDEAGRTVRRVMGESGGIVEQTLNESGEVSEETVVGEASAT